MGLTQIQAAPSMGVSTNPSQNLEGLKLAYRNLFLQSIRFDFSVFMVSADGQAQINSPAELVIDEMLTHADVRPLVSMLAQGTPNEDFGAALYSLFSKCLEGAVNDSAENHLEFIKGE